MITVPYDKRTSLPAKPGLYIVYSGATCLYVGSSVNVLSRLRKHGNSEMFGAHNATHVDFVPVAEDQLGGEENSAIRKLRPILNKYAAKSIARKPDATARSVKPTESKLRDTTLRMLNGRRRTLTLKQISQDTGLGIGFLSAFSCSATPNPGVCGVERLYEYLSGKSLDV